MASHIGPAIDLVDGRDKVTGRARYAMEHPLANTAHAVLMVSTIAKGRVAAMDTSLATRAPGVLAGMTPCEAHNPMEPHATTAVWEGSRKLTLYDATQGVFGCRARVAELLGLDPADVRVLAPYLGGGFGSKGPTWSHVVLAAMAAREVKRPVKLALTRPQMFGPIGHRSQTRQSIALGARRDGTLTALRHDTLAHTSTFDEFMEAAGTAAAMLYAVPNCAIGHKLVRSDIG